MRIINFGSINIDHVYRIPHFVRPGETLASSDYQIFPGGKGFNQSIACARAGASVSHAGCVGKEAGWMVERLRNEGVETSCIQIINQHTGHAIIQVIPTGENAIILYPGANQSVDKTLIETTLHNLHSADLVLLQNETASVADAIQMAKESGLKVVFNPAPMSPEVLKYPLESIDLFIMNQTEAFELTGETEPARIRQVMIERFPQASTVFTMGAEGAMFFNASQNLYQPARQVKAVDTTAAGDTFTGYFLAEWMVHGDPARSLSVGAHAAALCVMRAGAADSIPFAADVLKFLGGR